MDLNSQIRSYSDQPLPHQLLHSLLREYNQPNAKITGLVKKGILETIKKGLYIAGPAITNQKPEPFLLANHILGPSYISLETALSHYGMIPERVYEIASMTTKASRRFKTSYGVFSYRNLPLPYYAFGLRQHKLSENQYALIASPEKALCDKIVTTPGLIFRSEVGAKTYLLDNMRMDENILRGLDTKEMASWLADTPKEKSISILIKILRSL